MLRKGDGGDMNQMLAEDMARKAYNDDALARGVENCVCDLNTALSAICEAGCRVDVDVSTFHIVGGGSIVTVRAEIFRPILPNEVPIAIKEPA